MPPNLSLILHTRRIIIPFFLSCYLLWFFVIIKLLFIINLHWLSLFPQLLPSLCSHVPTCEISILQEPWGSYPQAIESQSPDKYKFYLCQRSLVMTQVIKRGSASLG